MRLTIIVATLLAAVVSSAPVLERRQSVPPDWRTTEVDARDGGGSPTWRVGTVAGRQTADWRAEEERQTADWRRQTADWRTEGEEEEEAKRQTADWRTTGEEEEAKEKRQGKTADW
ncbi:hypothetical protein CYLTODRAFT_411809 [Cylindrobasidium torrendii FP15055 ss-10]|uniref:Uncharacterized protein n=1 Tax=Cylindrobasidium torrendii FP15055 ss-10 TaxID=1314674 RepID=A0A0D7BAC6_9AGAR|nr:hypothetical protein CYLTODRAFT_411809 [Cylindrobasidium torrendii FP15055 ss-10]